MSLHDDTTPTSEEQVLLRELENITEWPQRLALLSQLKDSIIGSRRSKNAFYHLGVLEVLNRYLEEYASSLSSIETCIEIVDCISSFAKSNEDDLMNSLFKLGFMEKILNLLSIKIDSIDYYQSCLRCLRSFFLPNSSLNLLAPINFISSSNEKKLDQMITSFPIQFAHSNDNQIPVKILFQTPNSLDILRNLLSLSKYAQISILEILSSVSIDNQRQNEIVEKDFIPIVVQLLVKSINDPSKTNLIKIGNELLIGHCVKFFASISYENPSVARRLHDTICSETKQNLCEILSNLLSKAHRSVVISYYGSKFFVHLCKCGVISPNDRFVSLQSLTTLIHLCTKSFRLKFVTLFLESLNTLAYLLDGNSTLHHSAIYTEQLLNRLFTFLLTPTKLSDEQIDENVIVQIRSSTLTVLAVLASYHVEIQKRIAEHDNLIPTAIECYRSNHPALQLAVLRLFHGLSRSVDQLHTTFNDTICDILFDALKSTDSSVMKTASCVVSNSVLEFSTCRPKLLSGGILDILLKMLNETDQELAINSIWALRNLSYLSTLKVKQEIIQRLTIDRIYSLLEQCTDEKFLLCLISLVQNLLTEKDMETLLPLFGLNKLQTTLQEMLLKNYSDKVHSEVERLYHQLDPSENSQQQQSSGDSVNSSCRTFLFPDYSCDEMDQLDCT